MSVCFIRLWKGGFIFGRYGVVIWKRGGMVVIFKFYEGLGVFLIGMEGGKMGGSDNFLQSLDCL